MVSYEELKKTNATVHVCHVMSTCVMLCHAMLCRVKLFYVMSCHVHAMLCYVN